MLNSKDDKISHGIKIALFTVPPVLLFFFTNSAIAFMLFLVSLFFLHSYKENNTLKYVVLLTNFLLIIPLVGIQNSSFLDVMTQIAIYSILAIGLNIVVGFAGLLDLGYVGFYAAGAYIYAIFASSQANSFMPASMQIFPLSGKWFWAFLLISLVCSAIIGILLGLPVLRLKGDYLAIVTLGFGEIIRIILNNMDKPINFTNGPQGLVGIQPPILFGYVLNKPIHYYFIVLTLFALSLIVAHRLNNSRIGRAWTSIREDELAARAMGVQLVRMKLTAFAFGAAFAGMMGVVFAAKQAYIDPSSFGFMESIGILAMVIMGGLGNISGVIFGAILLIGLQLQILKDLSGFLRDLSVSGIINLPTQLDPAKYERLVFGLILIIMCIFKPKGIFPAKRSIGYIKKLFRKSVKEL